MAHRYSNLDPRQRPPGFRAILRWGFLDRVTGRRRVAPPGPPAPWVEPDLELIQSDSARPRLTWIGHASFLLQVGGLSILIDPVFARRLGWIYPRYGAPGLGADQLPEIAAVLISHNHYDHLDLAALRAVGRTEKTAKTVKTGTVPLFPLFVPTGLGGYLRGRVPQEVHELGWWESSSVEGVTITLVPSRHWSRRHVFDTNHTHWGGFVIESSGCSVYYAGDSAWFDGFAEIGRRFPELDVAILPIGGYEPAWFMENNHMNPEQAGEAFLQTGAHRLVPCHWGAFQLTDEPLCEPIDRFEAWWRQTAALAGKELSVLAVGETVVLED